MLRPQLRGSVVLAARVVRAQLAPLKMLVRHFPRVRVRYVPGYL
ncbi:MULTISPECIES: hypothetical protein [unclassified Streptomyces]|nr:MULTISPECIES: hypothetical protein [unclassified Streptomyces]